MRGQLADVILGSSGAFRVRPTGEPLVSEFTLSQVPIPPRTRPPIKGMPPKYPWAQMKVGDSFFVPMPKGRGFTAHQSHMKTHPNNGKYETRNVVENGDTGVRVWRVK